jgi:hypothetical protein
MQGKLKLRHHILLFSLAVFFLTALTLAISYTSLYVLPLKLLLIFLWIIAFPLVIAFAYDFLLVEGRLSVKKVLLLTLSVVIVSTTLIQGVLAIVTPSWSFSVTTDKSAYKLGENVIIIAVLKNTGFITHSFKSRISDPVVVGVESIRSEVWYSLFHENATDFSIGPSSSLDRYITWNQTNVYSPEKQIESGTYRIHAFIPNADPNVFIDEVSLFRAWTTFNIAST